MYRPPRSDASGDEIFATIQWDLEVFGSGTKIIDDQHEHLLCIINNMCRKAATIPALGLCQSESRGVAQKRKKPTPLDRYFDENLQRGSEMADLIDQLVTYCARHLANEEHLLETSGFTEKASHIEEHEHFVAQVNHAFHLMEEHNMEPRDILTLILFLKRWMREHIQKDRKYAKLLQDRGIGP